MEDQLRKTTPPALRAELDRSLDDLAARRMHQLTPVLAAIRQRASARHERRKRIVSGPKEQRLAEQV
jgi:hypothetical protein